MELSIHWAAEVCLLPRATAGRFTLAPFDSLKRDSWVQNPWASINTSQVRERRSPRSRSHAGGEHFCQAPGFRGELCAPGSGYLTSGCLICFLKRAIRHSAEGVIFKLFHLLVVIRQLWWAWMWSGFMIDSLLNLLMSSNHLRGDEAQKWEPQLWKILSITARRWGYISSQAPVRWWNASIWCKTQTAQFDSDVIAN